MERHTIEELAKAYLSDVAKRCQNSCTLIYGPADAIEKLEAMQGLLSTYIKNIKNDALVLHGIGLDIGNTARICRFGQRQALDKLEQSALQTLASIESRRQEIE